MRPLTVSLPTSHQAEKLRSSSLSQELCVLSVIEILYLWKALANCSASKLQSMTQGESTSLTCSQTHPPAVTSPLGFPPQCCRGSTTPPAQASSICCSVPFKDVCTTPKRPSRYLTDTQAVS